MIGAAVVTAQTPAAQAKPAAATRRKTTLSGIYTAAQVDQGRGDVLRLVRELPSEGHVRRAELQDELEQSAALGSLGLDFEQDAQERSGHADARSKSVQVMAYILQQNKMPAGKTPLPAERRRRSTASRSRSSSQASWPCMKGETSRWVHGHHARGVGLAQRHLLRARDRAAFTMWPPARQQRSCAATRRASGATGAPTRGARATRRSIRSTRRTSTRCRSRGAGTPRSTATTSTTGRRRSTRTAGCSRSRRRIATPTRSIPRRARRSGSWKLEEGIRWQKAPRQFAGRGLAYWTDGRGNERVVVVTPGYHMAILDAKTGKGDPAIGKNGVDRSDGGARVAARAARRRRYRVLRGQRHAAGAQGQAGRDLGQGEEASAPTARSASIRRSARSPPAARRSSSATSSSSAARTSTATTRRGCATCPAGFAVSTSRPASSSGSSTSIPQPGEFGAETWKNGSKIGTRRRRQERRVGDRTRRIRISASSTFRSACRSATSTAAIVPATTCTATASSRST